jgi:hypothetical protein
VAVGINTTKGEVYKAVLTRVQEQEVEVEIMEDGENLHAALWETVDNSGWETVSREVDAVEIITCGGEI